ncbi:tetratricopeptide repeat protein [Pedobacter arcticus]|uniref:tetratricopeptide repeat protein n=1 Tax=Pedobacter arcticus TaxID=752140 RepID=UPI00031E52C7|nr:tetratricopeptide repeat protein [Pedobacter arcticus]
MCKPFKILSTVLLLLACFNYAKSQNSVNDMELARQFYNNGEYDKSLAIYQKFYQHNTENDFYFEAYFNTLLKLKNYSEAEKIVTKRLKINSKYGINLGQLYLEKGEVDKADKTFDDVLNKMPKDEFAISGIANSFYSTGNYDYAIKCFLTGRKLLKDEYAFSFELINLYRFKKQKAELTDEVLNTLVYQPSFLANAKNNLARTYERDEDYATLKSLLLKKIQKDPQNTTFINLLAWAYLQQKQYDLALVQLIALDKRTQDDGASLYNFANILIENNAYATAEKAYQYILTKGQNTPYYIASKVAMLQLKNQQVIDGTYSQQQIEQLSTDYELLLKEYGENPQTIFAIRALANLKAFYGTKTQEATLLLEKAISLPNINPDIAAQLKLDLATIYILNNQPWDAALLYGQVEKNFKDHPIGQEAKFKNAKLSFYNGDFSWAKAQLDVLKASTSQLIANDALDLSLLIQDDLAVDSTGNALKMYAKADLLQLKNKPSEAIKTLDSLTALYPQSSLFDDVLMLKSNIYIKQQQYQTAQNNLSTIVKNYPNSIWADDALFKLAVLEEENLQDLNAAKKYYQQLMNQYPGSLYLIEARKRFRNLRGDAL